MDDPRYKDRDSFRNEDEPSTRMMHPIERELFEDESFLSKSSAFGNERSFRHSLNNSGYNQESSITIQSYPCPKINLD